MKTYNQALIIDDELDLCVLLKALLADTIQDVKYAHSIESAEKFLIKLKPDVIFLDNNLPDGQGLNYIQKVKSLAPQALLIVISAAENYRDKALEYGADIFLDKPLSHEHVLNALNSAKAGG